MPTPFSYNFAGISGFSGATGSNGTPGTSLLISTQSNTFSAGQAIYRSAGSYVLAQANAVSSSDVTGIIQNVTSTALTAVVNGNISGLTGLVDGNEYWLSDTTAGALVSAQPTAAGSVIKPLLIATGTSTGVVVTYPGALIGSTNYGISGYYGKWTGAQNLGTGLITDDGISVVTVNNTLSTVNVSAANLYVTNLTVPGPSKIQQVYELMSIQPVNTFGTVNVNVLSGAAYYYTSNATGNWTYNFIGNGSTPLSSVLDVGRSATIAIAATQGTTAFYLSAIQIDGVSQTAKWQGGTAPTSGDASSTDIYTFTIVKTAATPTYTVFAAQTQFK
jgi:hypothetical protein